jgi:hypothetical protein
MAISVYGGDWEKGTMWVHHVKEEENHMAEHWTINDMSLPARKYIRVWAGHVEVLIKQIEKGKAYAISQVPQTAKVAYLIAAAPELLAACEMAAEFYHESSDEELCTEEKLCVYCAAIAKARGTV